MKRLASIFLIILILLIPITAAKKKVPFDAQAAWNYIKDLAADEMEGRKSGQPGGVMGEEYIASRLKEWGLEPAGDSGTYFQNYTFDYYNINEGAVLEIITDKERRSFICEDDWNIQMFSGSGHFMSEIVFAGYGVHAPDKDYDDYAGVDIKGKVILISDKMPSKLEEKLGKAAFIENRIKVARELGGRGAMTFNNSSDIAKMLRIWTNSKLYNKDFVWLSVEDSVVKTIFKELGTDLRYHIRETEKTLKPTSFETGIKAFVSVSAVLDKKRTTRNVLAKITGKDSELKDEYVILGAHLDHVGLDTFGEIRNGANDNASGTAVVMELARIMKLNADSPLRTVIFALWSGEEQGLLGSKYYASHPLYPLEKTVLNINLDMVGHGKEKILLRGTYYGPQIWKLFQEKLPKEMVDSIKPSRGGPAGSDHTPFLDYGIPAFFIQSDGPHIKYHQSRDDIDLINLPALKLSGEFLYAATSLMGSERGDFISPRRREDAHFKYQTIINHHPCPLEKVIDDHADVENPLVDLQLALIDPGQGFSGDSLRLEIIKRLLSASKTIKESKGLLFYSSPQNVYYDMLQESPGKTTVLIGLNGFDAFRDDPSWAQALAKQGVGFIRTDNAPFLFAEKSLSEEGKKLVDALNTSGLMLIIGGLDSAQSKALLEGSKKPVILLDSNLPDKEILNLIKEKKSAFGLILGSQENPSAYFKKLDKAKKLIDAEHLMIVSKSSLFGKPGQEQMLGIISEILNAGYKSMDIFNLFSVTFMRVLSKVRGEQEPAIFTMLPIW